MKSQLLRLWRLRNLIAFLFIISVLAIGSCNSNKLNIHVQNRLSNITCPTLIIYGKDDLIIEESPLLENQLIANSNLVFIKGAGHYPYIENKEDFLRELNNFINDTRPKNIYER